MTLKTNWKNDIFSGSRKYKQINNGDGTISLQDQTTYTQRGDRLDATTLNDICVAINRNMKKPNIFYGTGNAPTSSMAVGDLFVKYK